MRFQKGIQYPHPKRGPGRGRYRVSDAARRARRQNLSRARLRSNRESSVIKLLIWQSVFDGGPRPSQRVIARQLGVYPSYVCKVQRQVAKGLDALANGTRVTLDDLVKARGLTAKLREREPGLLAAAPERQESERRPCLTDDEYIAKTWREVQEWKRNHIGSGGSGRRVLFSVRVPRRGI